MPHLCCPTASHFLSEGEAAWPSPSVLFGARMSGCRCHQWDRRTELSGKAWLGVPQGHGPCGMGVKKGRYWEGVPIRQRGVVSARLG